MKYGVAFARRIVALVHERRRRERLHHPTPGEAALRALLVELGFQVLLLETRFDYCQWCCDPIDWQLGPDDALAEGGVGPYACDLLLPVRRIAIEVEGGIHRLTQTRDATRAAFLARCGLTVLLLTNEQALDAGIARQQLAPILG